MDWCKQKWVNLKAHSLHGRLNRWRYFTWHVGYGFLLLIPAMVIALAAYLTSWLLAVLIFPLAIFQYVVITLLLIGRVHDLGYSGWYVAGWYALSFIGQFFGEVVALILGIIDVIVILILLFKRGTVGPNRFGNDPVDEE